LRNPVTVAIRVAICAFDALVVAVRGHELADRCDRRAQLAARDDRVDALPHLIEPQLPATGGGVQEHLDRGRELRSTRAPDAGAGAPSP
jgi:hypothetical protein